MRVEHMVESATSTNKFNRLVVFGCSHTLGQHLPGWSQWWEDQGYDKVKIYREQLSDLNWPSVLAHKLGITDLLNLASGGNSNHEIMARVLSFEFKPDDLCIICWSYAGREFIYQEHGGVARTMDLLDVLNDSRFYEVHSQFDLEMKSREYVYLTYLHLERNSVNYKMAKIEKWESVSDFWVRYEHDDLLTFDMLDYALDHSHPGVESHKVFANKIYDTIK